MLVRLSENSQTNLLKEAVKKAGSERKLESRTKIPDTSINEYKLNRRKMPYARFKLLLSFLGYKKSDFKFELVDPKTYRVKGGKAVYTKYIQQGRFWEIHQKMRRASSERMKKWHKKMKNEKTEAYYKLQYSRFKKVSEYKLKANRGEFVRNQLELEVANRLFELGLDYQYEPYVKGFDSSYLFRF